MVFAYSLMLAVLEIVLFSSIAQRTGGKLFTAELVFIASFIILALLEKINLESKPTARFLMQPLFLAATANAVLLYLALPLSLGILMGAAIGLAGFTIASIISQKRQRPAEKTRQKKTEGKKQLGPTEEPKVIIEETPRKRKPRRRKR